LGTRNRKTGQHQQQQNSQEFCGQVSLQLEEGPEYLYMRYAEVRMGESDGVPCTCSTSMAILEMTAALRPLGPGRSFDTGDARSDRGDGGE